MGDGGAWDGEAGGVEKVGRLPSVEEGGFEGGIGAEGGAAEEEEKEEEEEGGVGLGMSREMSKKGSSVTEEKPQPEQVTSDLMVPLKMVWTMQSHLSPVVLLLLGTTPSSPFVCLLLLLLLL